MPQDMPPLPLDPACFGQGAAQHVELLQTHIGWVYLLDEYAIKLKKAVKFDFLDFSTLEGRRWACEREVTLNRRLCPHLYLGIVPVFRAGSQTWVELAASRDLPGNSPLSGMVSAKNAAAELVDWAVWMKRLPSERMLNVLLDAQTATSSDFEHIADLLGEFYRRQRGSIPAGGLGDLDAVKINVDENLREGWALDRHVLSEGSLCLIECRARRFLSKYGVMIQQRAREGFIVDGHGDLRAENICIPSPADGPPLLFDCIEFNDRFRIADSALDVAYLAMELDSRARTDLGNAFLERYKKNCDPNLPKKLFNFYLGYRAFVKGKVAAWIGMDKQVECKQRESSLSQARHLFDLAVRYALLDEPALLVFCGPAGSGKSTLASELAARLNFKHIATDYLRDCFVPRGAAPEQRYASAISAQVYQALINKAAECLDSGESVILDGTFGTAANRKRAAELARERNAACVLIWADCAPAAALEHVAARTASGQCFGSEAGAGVAAAQQLSFEMPQPDEGFRAVCRIDTSTTLHESKQKAWEEIMAALAAR